jgi:YVTN family beta-propeller protein
MTRRSLISLTLVLVALDVTTAAQRGRSAAASKRRPESRHYAVYVSNERSASVSLIDGTTDKVLATIPVGTRPRGLHVSRDGSRLYVALSDNAQALQGSGDALAVIDTSTRQVVRRFDAGSDPEQFAIAPDGRRLYSANEDAGTATITDVATGKVLGTLIVGIEPEGVGISPDGRWVYVTAETSNTVSVIDTLQRKIVASFMVDPRPSGEKVMPRVGDHRDRRQRPRDRHDHAPRAEDRPARRGCQARGGRRGTARCPGLRR